MSCDLDLAYEPPFVQTEAEPADSGEAILTDSSNNIIGSAAFFDNDMDFGHELSPPITQATNIQELAKCTVRIIVEYTGSQSKHNHQVTGTGFFISPQVILTAWSVVANKQQLQMPNLQTREESSFSSISFTPTIDAAKLYKVTKFRAMRIHPMSTKTEKETYKMKEKNLERTWAYSNDFAFLFVDELVYTSKYFAFPSSLSNPKGDAIVIGYPGYISKEDFMTKYNQKTQEEAKDLYISAMQMFKNFGIKSISTGAYANENGEFFVFHTAPTLGGMAGGPFVVQDNQGIHPTFAGIHVGGDLDMLSNFAISVSRPTFKKEYIEVMKKYSPEVLSNSVVQKYVKEQ